MVSFSHMIFYIKDIPSALTFYKKAFGISPKFVHESNQYAELDTGATTIAFASETLGESNLIGGYIKQDVHQKPFACEIVFSVQDVDNAYETAIQAGAIAVVGPKHKPWGQIVAYVRDPNGILIELASPLG